MQDELEKSSKRRMSFKRLKKIMDKEYRQKRSNISMLKKIRQIDKQNLKIGNPTEKEHNRQT